MTTTERQPHTENQAHSPAPAVAPKALEEQPSDGRVLPHRSRLTREGAERFGLPDPNVMVAGNGQARNHRDRPQGVEVRVHGIGDHDRYSALGRPSYKELVDSRVWIGQVPRLPSHELRLVNWSRANRKLTRHLSWYLAFPFTLVNVAGYMEPRQRVFRPLMRAGVAVAGLLLTISMAAWITVILESCWQKMGLRDDRLTAVVLQVIGPGLFILFIAYRMVIGRVLVDRGGALVSVTSIAALAGMVPILHTKPASKTGDWLHRLFLPDGAPDNTVDAMTALVVVSTAIIWITAMGLCVLALWKKQDCAAFAGAAALLVLAVSLMHTAGSMLRLFTDSLLRFVPDAQTPFRHIAPGSYISNVLLPKPTGFQTAEVSYAGSALWIDLTPVFFLAMLTLAAIAVRIELRRQRKRLEVTPGSKRPGFKEATVTHALVESLPKHLAPLVAVAILCTGILWILMGYAFVWATPRQRDDILLGLQIAGAIAIVLVIIRRPEKLADRLRRTFGSIADIAGFWAPDLHPLAGASYRRALLAGIRQTINDLVMDFPNLPIALVGHSQGSVVCAWFVRGGHWTEQPTEGRTDRRALKENLHQAGNTARSGRIALYTCGSPLSTLYQTFFPRYFDCAFFSKTAGMTYNGSWWRNYWRKTDPIGSELPTKRPRDNIDVTERSCAETVGHGEYWREERLRGGIESFFGSAVVKAPVREEKSVSPAAS